MGAENLGEVWGPYGFERAQPSLCTCCSRKPPNLGRGPRAAVRRRASCERQHGFNVLPVRVGPSSLQETLETLVVKTYNATASHPR